MLSKANLRVYYFLGLKMKNMYEVLSIDILIEVKIYEVWFGSQFTQKYVIGFVPTLVSTPKINKHQQCSQ